jgi:predicted nucleic acid-binding protein
VYLIDTNVVSELRRDAKADTGVIRFFKEAHGSLYVPVQVVGELRYGVESLRRKGDLLQAGRLDAWLKTTLKIFTGKILNFDLECAQIWGTMSAATHQSAVDKQIAAVALSYGLTIATRNTNDFSGTGAQVLNPFEADTPEVASTP